MTQQNVLLPVPWMPQKMTASTKPSAGYNLPARPNVGIDLLTRERGMEPRISLITLGVADVDRSRAFYEGLGWTTRAAPGDDVVFFQAAGMVVALWSRERLAEDSGVADAGGWGGVTLAYNTRSPEDVDAVVEEARAAGAQIPREPAETFWGGYSGMFVDPDGHPWEVAHNPHWTITDEGATVLPD